MNNEKFQLFPSNCKPLSNLLLIASTKYNKTETVDKMDHGNRTALTIAIMLMEMDAIDLLLKSGANPSLVQISYYNYNHQLLILQCVRHNTIVS